LLVSLSARTGETGKNRTDLRDGAPKAVAAGLYEIKDGTRCPLDTDDLKIGRAARCGGEDVSSAVTKLSECFGPATIESDDVSRGFHGENMIDRNAGKCNEINVFFPHQTIFNTFGNVRKM